MTEQADPVHEEKGKWYFWDETWADRYGPYDSEQKARTAMEKYSEETLGL